MLLDLPLELIEEIFSFLLIEWFSIDCKILTKVLLDRDRIGSIEKARYGGRKWHGKDFVFDASMLLLLP